MKLWLANEPREIIIVTVPRDLQHVKELLRVVDLERYPHVPVSVLTVPRPGRREQMSLAIKHATGRIVAYVDDDTYWPSSKVLPYLLAGFEDPGVGGVGGKQRLVFVFTLQTSRGRRLTNFVYPVQVPLCQLLVERLV